jgi:hypothetical protein
MVETHGRVSLLKFILIFPVIGRIGAKAGDIVFIKEIKPL